MSSSREEIISMVVQWYTYRHEARPFYRICFGEMAGDRSRTFSVRAWGSKDEKKNTDQFLSYLRQDLQMMPAGSYVVQIRRNGSDNLNFEELPFYLPANAGAAAAAPALNGVPADFVSKAEVSVQVGEAVENALNKFRNEQRIAELERDLKEAKKELKEKGDITIAQALVHLTNVGAPIVGKLLGINSNPASVSGAGAGAEKKKDESEIELTAEIIDSMDDELDIELNRFQVHCNDEPGEVIKKLRALNDALDNPATKEMLFSMVR
jgi:hypothetical protein